MKKIKILIVLITCCFISSCGKSDESIEVYPVVKVGKDNSVFISKDPHTMSVDKIPIEDLSKYLEEFKKSYSAVVYFRERMKSDPDSKYTAHIKRVLGIIVKSGMDIMFGEHYIHTVGEITDFIVTVSPEKFHYGANKEKVFVIRYIPKGENNITTFSTMDISSWIWKDKIEPEFKLLFISNRIESEPSRDADKVLDDEYLKKPSVHIKVVLNDEYTKSMYYNIDKVPSNVQSFIDDCQDLAKEYVETFDIKERRQ